MWAEDKVRLEIGMPGAQRGEEARARDGRMRTGEKSGRKERRNTEILIFSKHQGKKTS